jgi:hypothetical protein
MCITSLHGVKISTMIDREVLRYTIASIIESTRGADVLENNWSGGVKVVVVASYFIGHTCLCWGPRPGFACLGTKVVKIVTLVRRNLPKVTPKPAE